MRNPCFSLHVQAQIQKSSYHCTGCPSAADQLSLIFYVIEGQYREGRLRPTASRLASYWSAHTTAPDLTTDTRGRASSICSIGGLRKTRHSYTFSGIRRNPPTSKPGKACPHVVTAYVRANRSDNHIRWHCSPDRLVAAHRKVTNRAKCR